MSTIDPKQAAPLAPDQILGKTFSATRNIVSEYDLKCGDAVVFGLRYMPNPEVEAAGGMAWSGTWGAQHWQVHHLKTLVHDKFSVFLDGTAILETSANNWQFSPREIQVTTPKGKTGYRQHLFSNTVMSDENQPIITTTQNWGWVTTSCNLTISATADPDVALPVLVYLLYAALVVEA